MHLSATMRPPLTQIILVIVFGCATLAGSAKAQILDKPVSLAIHEGELRQLLQQIQQLADVKFVYSPTAIGADRKVSVQAANHSLGSVLDQVLRPLHIQYKLLNDRILLSQSSTAPAENSLTAQANTESEEKAQMHLAGQVVDDKHLALPGVSIQLKGTLLGTTADRAGKYTLVIPYEHRQGTLLFSYVGYKPIEVPINNQAVINTGLEAATHALTEVIITGYQPIRKESFTGTALTVSGDEQKKINPLNFLQSLQAFDPSFRYQQNNIFGSDPNRLPEIIIRGATGLPTTESAAPESAPLR